MADRPSVRFEPQPGSRDMVVPGAAQLDGLCFYYSSLTGFLTVTGKIDGYLPLIGMRMNLSQVRELQHLLDGFLFDAED